MKQTAVEWLVENSHIVPKNELNKRELIKQAKEMEKQQQYDYAIEFADWVNVNAYKYPTKTTAKELLEIFKNK